MNIENTRNAVFVTGKLFTVVYLRSASGKNCYRARSYGERSKLVYDLIVFGDVIIVVVNDQNASLKDSVVRRSRIGL